MLTGKRLLTAGGLMRISSMRSVIAAISISSIIALAPLISSESAQASTLCGTVGIYTACGTAQGVSNSLIAYMKYLTAGIIQNDSDIQQKNSSSGYQSALNQLSRYVYRPTSAQQGLLNMFPAEAGDFRNAIIDEPFTREAENTTYYEGTTMNANVAWLATPSQLLGSLDEFMFDLAAA